MEKRTFGKEFELDAVRRMEGCKNIQALAFPAKILEHTSSTVTERIADSMLLHFVA